MVLFYYFLVNKSNYLKPKVFGIRLTAKLPAFLNYYLWNITDCLNNIMVRKIVTLLNILPRVKL